MERLQEVLQDGIRNNETVGGNLLCFQGGKEIYYTQAGVRCLETKEPIHRDTIFRLYSMSKPILSGAVMLLVEQGKIDLLDFVQKYLPGFSNQTVWRNGKAEPIGWPMSIKDLLNMTSGLTYPGTLSEAEKGCAIVFERLEAGLTPGSPYEHYGTVEAMNELGTYPLLFSPGERWNYSASADVLGAVIEVVSGMRLSEFLQKNIFEPLDMKDTAFYVPQEKQSRLAYSYEWTKDGWSRYDGCHLAISNRMEKEPVFQSGGAGLCATIDDYAHYANMLMNQGEYAGTRLLSRKTVEYMTGCTVTPQQAVSLNWDGLRGYSYGNLLRVLTKPQECTHLCTEGEYGWDGWLGCFFMNVPKDDLTFLFMMQKKDCGTVNLTRRLINTLYSELTK